MNITSAESIDVSLEAPLRVCPVESEPPKAPLGLIKIPLSIAAPPAVVTPILTSEDQMNICGNDVKVGRWSEKEHAVFLEGLDLHGKQWKTIAMMIGTRSVVQVRTHAQKYFQKLERKIKPVPKRKSISVPTTSSSISASNNFNHEEANHKKPKRVSARLSVTDHKTIQEGKTTTPSPVIIETTHDDMETLHNVFMPKQTACPSPNHISETLSEFIEPAGSPHTVTEYLDEHAAALGLLDDEPLEWLLDSELAGLDVLSDETFGHSVDDDDGLQPMLHY